MTTTTQAPPKRENGAGQIVSPVRQTARRAKRNRRTSLLSTMTPAERRPFLQEMLDQSAIFRQIACAKNGVTGPHHRNVIGEVDEDEVQEYAEESGVSIEEVRRREEMARREAMIELREEVLRREQKRLREQEEDLRRPDDSASSTQPAPEPIKDPPPGQDMTEEEARRREELARREQLLKDQEDDLR